MTIPGRNDPCPCGSGRKYKSCCQKRVEDAAAENRVALTAEMRQAAAAARAWEVDAVPVNIAISGQESRPVLVIVVGAGFVLGLKTLNRLAGNPTDICVVLEQAIVRAAGEVGAFPERIRIRFADLYDPLSAALRGRDITVEVAERLPDLEEAALSAMREMNPHAAWPPVCLPDRVNAWDLPRSTLRELFAAAAAYWRAAPWTSIENEQAPMVTTPSGRTWRVSVMGAAGNTYGLVLYSDPDDLARHIDADTGRYPFAAIRGKIIALTFDRSDQLLPAILREASTAGWEIADPKRFPILMTVNTPAGGVSSRDADDLIASLRTIPGFVRKWRAELVAEVEAFEPPVIEWHDQETGTVVRYDGGVHYESDDYDDIPPGPDLKDLFTEIRSQLDPEASEEEILAAFQSAAATHMQDYNNQAQADLGNLSPAQVKRLMQRDWSGGGAITLNRNLTLQDLHGATILNDARVLLSLAVERDGLRVTDKGNLNLAVVREMLDRMQNLEIYSYYRDTKRPGEEQVRPLHRLRVLLELAGLLHRERNMLRTTDAGEYLAHDSRAGELFARLFETRFLMMSLPYDFRLSPWPELQVQIGYSLYRLGEIASDWVSPRDIVDEVVLPFAVSRGPATEYFGVESHLRLTLFEQLQLFGLMESSSSDPMMILERTFRKLPLYDRFLQFKV